MHIQLIDISKIIPYSNNPRKHQAVDKVAQSIQQFGFRQPIVVDKDFVVIAGHTRLLASKKLNLQQVPIHIATDLTAKQVKAYRLADNRVQEAEWDNELLFQELKDLPDIFTGFDKQEIDTLFAKYDDKHTDEDQTPEPKLSSDTKLGDVFILGNHRLICGDSTDPIYYNKLLNDERVDLVLTDPPYGVEYVGKTKDALTIQNDQQSVSNLESVLYPAFKNVFNVMKQGAVVYCFHADTKDITFKSALTEAGIKLTMSLVWVKNILVFGRLDYQARHEPILYGWKPGAGHYFTGDRTLTSVMDDEADYNKLTKEQLVNIIKSIKTSVLRHDKPSRSALHPTTKPVKLIQELMENSSKPEQIVLDPFGGSGSTLIAGENCNRATRLIELDPVYCDVIVKRWEEYTNKTALKQV